MSCDLEQLDVLTCVALENSSDNYALGLGKANNASVFYVSKHNS